MQDIDYFNISKATAMKRISLLFISLSFFVCIKAQYKNDNVLFKTVYTQDLCDEMAKQAGYIILDVRTPGEYADTSTRGLNIGRFKDARNINVQDLGTRINELSAYKDVPVFVVCSHSQRSRRASKMLADSGFKKVFNINGGMTGILQLPVAGNECIYNKLTTRNNYALLSAVEFCQKLSDQNAFLLDVRDDSSYNHISKDAKINAYGSFRGATHFSLADINSGHANIPKNKEIVITDLFGDDAEKAAKILLDKGYKNVSVLLEGIDRILYNNNNSITCFKNDYISPVKFNIISAQQLPSLMQKNPGFVFLDVRTKDEYENKHKNSWMNIGHVKDAINIPVADLKQQIASIGHYKNSPVIIYAFGSSTPAYEAAYTLVENGFTNVNVLQGGIFNIGWTAANIKGYSDLASLRVDVPNNQ